MTITDRFWDRVRKRSDGCWEWVGRIEANGYGRFQIDGHGHLAHRFAYELLVGPIPDGMQLDHLCRNRDCVNPAHLEPVTCRENLMRGDTLAAANAAKTECPQGHPYDESNTYVARGRRECRACQRARSARYRASRAGAT